MPCSRLDGIERKLEVSEGIDYNIFEMSESERLDKNIETLPDNLYDAVLELKKDKVICDVLGPHILDKYVQAKLKEWDDYRTQVSEWEIEEYLYKF